jgi:hypothetical protein
MIFPVASVSRPALGPIQPLSNGYRGSFSGIKRGWGVTLTTQPHLLLRARMSRSLPRVPLVACVVVAGQFYLDVVRIRFSGRLLCCGNKCSGAMTRYTLNGWIISEFGEVHNSVNPFSHEHYSVLTSNRTMRLHYKDQLVNTAYGTSHCLFWNINTLNGQNANFLRVKSQRYIYLPLCSKMIIPTNIMCLKASDSPKFIATKMLLCVGKRTHIWLSRDFWSATLKFIKICFLFYNIQIK